MQKQLGGLEAHTVGAYIKDSILHGLERFGDLGDRAAVALDKVDFVIRFLGNATRYFRYEKVPYLSRIDRGTGGVAGADS